MSLYDQIALKIIQEQELLMGPIAWMEAGKVTGLRADRTGRTATVEDGAEPRTVINGLVERFTNLFGRAGHEVCREAVSALVADMKPAEIPSSLAEHAGVLQPA